MNKLLTKKKIHLPGVKAHLGGDVGFTLVELLVVVGIIAILMVVGIALYSNNLKKARDTTRKQDIQSIAAAMESGYSAIGYPDLSPAMFVKEQIPIDPLADEQTRKTDSLDCGGQICEYCVVTPGTPMANAACDGSTPAIDEGQPPAGSSYIICANLETGGSFCLKNQQ